MPGKPLLGVVALSAHLSAPNGYLAGVIRRQLASMATCVAPFTATDCVESRLVPGQTGPYAVGPAQLDGTTLSGTITFNQAPNVDWAGVVLTAGGPDGQRYLLDASGPERTEFFGSV
jgi:hypothetical protein